MKGITAALSIAMAYASVEENEEEALHWLESEFEEGSRAHRGNFILR
jgi:hypothetical protein